MKSVEQTLYKMLVEDTGINMLDSGGKNNRNWQQNQKKTLEDFMNEPMVEIEVTEMDKDSTDLMPSVSVFHYLRHALDINKVCGRFNELEVKDWDSHLFGTGKKQFEWLKNEGFYFVDITGKHSLNELGRFKGAFNTYNGDSNLSQVIQGYTGLKREGDNNHYALIQLHNGADVRGGYTDAKLFIQNHEYIDPNPTIYGTIDGVEVDTAYDGYQLLNEEGQPVPVNIDSKVELNASIDY